VGILNDLSNLKFDGKGETTILHRTAQFLEFCTKYNIHYEDAACRLSILRFEAGVKEWCYTLLTASIYSFDHVFKELFRAFGRCDYKSVFKKIMQLQKAPDILLNYFHDHFIHLCFDFSKDDVNWNLMKEKL